MFCKFESVMLIMQIDSAKTRAIKLTESTLVISNIDIVTTYVFRGNRGALMPAASVIQNDIIGPALSEAQVSHLLLLVR